MKRWRWAAMGLLALAACGCGSTTTSGAATTNGCDPATAEDDTGKTAVSIAFGGTTGLKFAPACIKVKAGTMVTFNGDFTMHPLSGGIDGTKDATSPITETKTGMSASFTLSTAGTYGYFCEVHVAGGMKGAIFVQ